MCRGFENGSAEQDRLTYDHEEDRVIVTDPFSVKQHTSHLAPGQPIRTQGAAAIAATRLEQQGYESPLLRTTKHAETGWCVVYEGDPRQLWTTMPEPG
jgi:hypothetical protein